MKKINILSLVMALVFLSSSALAFSWSYGPAVPATPGSAFEKYSRKPLAKLVEEATGGQLTLTVHEELIPVVKIIDAVRDGSLDFGLQCQAFRAELALMNFLVLPIIDRSKVPEMMNELKPIFDQELREKHQVELVGWGYFGNSVLGTKKPINSIKDLKGLKIRVHSQELAGMLKAAGANPIFMPMPEVYPALQRGVIEGVVTPYNGLHALKLYEVCRYISEWPMGTAGMIWVANLDSWKKLPQDLQAKVKMFFKEKAEEDTFHVTLQDNLKARKEMEADGVKVTNISKADWDKYLSNYEVVLKPWKKLSGPKADEVLGIINKAMGTNY